MLLTPSRTSVCWGMQKFALTPVGCGECVAALGPAAVVVALSKNTNHYMLEYVHARMQHNYNEQLRWF